MMSVIGYGVLGNEKDRGEKLNMHRKIYLIDTL